TRLVRGLREGGMPTWIAWSDWLLIAATVGRVLLVILPSVFVASLPKAVSREPCAVCAGASILVVGRTRPHRGVFADRGCLGGRRSRRAGRRCRPRSTGHDERGHDSPETRRHEAERRPPEGRQRAR